MKHLNMLLESCVGCPFLCEDAFGVTAVRFWDCHHPETCGNTVISEEEIVCEPWQELEGHMLKQKHPSGFPYWCPHEDVAKGGKL